MELKLPMNNSNLAEFEIKSMNEFRFFTMRLRMLHLDTIKLIYLEFALGSRMTEKFELLKT